MSLGTKTLFTADEANRILPLVRSIVTDLVAEFRALRSAGRERRALEAETGDGADATRRIDELRVVVADGSVRVEGYLRELADLGLEVRDLELGLVDFPTLLEGEPAFLCWRMGEETVGFWHPADRGYSERSPLGARRS